jgi:hypothetical protein
MAEISIDPEYDFVPPLKPEWASVKRGVQCGECGVKFDYGLTFAYCCDNVRCPLGFGPATYAVKP